MESHCLSEDGGIGPSPPMFVRNGPGAMALTRICQRASSSPESSDWTSPWAMMSTRSQTAASSSKSLDTHSAATPLSAVSRTMR